MISPQQPAHNLKLIKVYKIESVQTKQLKSKTEQIIAKLTNFINWSSINQAQLNQEFLCFPNQSIYKDGIRISHAPENKYHTLELIKAKWNVEFNDCFSYQYQASLFQEDPSKVFKAFTYTSMKRKAKHVTCFQSLRYGLQVLVYHYGEKDEANDKIKRGKLEVVQTGGYSFGAYGFLFKNIEALLGDLIIKPLQSQLQHEVMSLQNMGPIEQYSN